MLWIEPIPSIFDQLKCNLEDFNKQRAFQALLTDVDDKEYEFHIANNSGQSSSILEFKQHKDIWPDIDYTKTVNLKSMTLSTLYKKAQVVPKNYQALIMDTQGSELLVLQGAIPILSHFKYIQTEAADFEAYEGCCQVSNINDFMGKHGYKELSRNETTSREGGGSYFDVLYKRSD